MNRLSDSRKFIVGRKTSCFPGFDPARNNDGCVMYFDSIKDIAEVMRYGGASDEDLLLAQTMESVGICKRCGAPLFPSFILGYKTQCFECDEDFYEFEQEGNYEKDQCCYLL